MYIKGLDIIKMVYIIGGELVNQTPLSIGAGRGALVGGIDNPIVRMSKVPYIPGSSLKGVLRSEAERYVKSFLPSEFVCNVLNPEDRESGELGRKEKFKENYEPCIICRIFGGPTLASHVMVSNAFPSSSFYTETKTSVSLNRITGAQQPGRLFDIEYIVPLTKFKFEMRVENIDLLGGSAEAKVVRYLMDILMKGQVWLGGRKSVGMGNVKLMNAKVSRIEFKDGQIIEEEVTKFIF